jgi:prepilin-type N-terminal cleavage/methylation domain-containing protein
MKTTSTSGMTLIEILMVLMIIVVIAAISIPGYKKSKDFLAVEPSVEDISTFLELGNRHSQAQNTEISCDFLLTDVTKNMTLTEANSSTALSTYTINPLLTVSTLPEIDELIFSPTSSITFKKNEAFVASESNLVITISNSAGISKNITVFYNSGQVQKEE